MKKSVSLRDVAEHAGVSLGTASKIVNNTGNVNDKMRADVLKAVRDLNYIPNLVARSLKTNLTYSIGIIIPEISNSFFTEVVTGIQNVFEPMNYSVLIYNTHLDSREEIKAFQIFNQKVDGIIFVSNTINDELKTVLKELTIPLVLISTYAEGFVSLNIDNEEAAFTAVEYLCQAGHTKIALISGKPDDLNAGYPRMKGYQKALKKNGLPVIEDYVKIGNFKFDDGIEITKELLALKNRPTAIFAASDTMAVGALHTALSKGFQVPQDISIIGFDDIEYARYCYPALTTVRQPRLQMGEEGAHKLHQLIEKKTVPVKNYIFDFEFIVRNSSAPV